jgi:hypothetical protein
MVKKDIQTKLSDFTYSTIRLENTRIKKLKLVGKELKQKFKRKITYDDIIDSLIDERRSQK